MKVRGRDLIFCRLLMGGRGFLARRREPRRQGLLPSPRRALATIFPLRSTRGRTGSQAEPMKGGSGPGTI